MSRAPGLTVGEPFRISLLHATYHRRGGPLEIRDAWLAAATRPFCVEYVVAMDADDEMTLAATRGIHRVVSPAWPGRVTAVRNWNAALSEATGELIVVISDDLFPPIGWDSMLRCSIGSLDPSSVSFALKVHDSERPGDVLLRHPIVSRAFVEEHGLFSSSYDGLYCDNDITLRAFWRSGIIDGRSIVMQHRHPVAGFAESESHSKMNRQSEHVAGSKVFARDWSRRQRRCSLLLTRSTRFSTGSSNGWRIVCSMNRARANVRYVVTLGDGRRTCKSVCSRVVSLVRDVFGGVIRARQEEAE